jgi:hypothetical protein
MWSRNWFGRNLGLTTLAAMFALSGCGVGLDRTMSLTISGSPIEVSAALGDITFQNAGSGEAAASTLFRAASVSQSRPSDHELNRTPMR